MQYKEKFHIWFVYFNEIIKYIYFIRNPSAVTSGKKDKTIYLQ